MKESYIIGGRVCGGNRGALVAIWSRIIRFGFWSLENKTDYYASLEDESPYLSIIEKE